MPPITPAPALRVVVMGVAGSGKTTIGRALATRLGMPFLDADDLLPAADVAKMATGHPLNEVDRRPWVAAVAQSLAAAPRLVCACSALSRHTRDELRAAGDVVFVDLVVSPPEAVARTTMRTGHFMGPGMVASQFEALEPPAADETDVVAVDAGAPTDVVAERAVLALRGRRPR